MKYLFYILLIANFVYAQEQEKTHGKFTFENKNINYTTYYFKGKIYPVNKFYLLINQDERTAKCLQNKYVRPYYLNISNDIPQEKYEQLFLAFFSHVAGKTKLLDSKMYVIADKKHTRLYREIRQEQDQYEGVLMNKIEEEYIGVKNDDICKILR